MRPQHSEVKSAFNRSVTARRNTRYDASSLWRREKRGASACDGELLPSEAALVRRISIGVNRKSATFMSRSA